MPDRNVALPDVPVYVVHMEEEAGSGLAACCGLPLPERPPESGWLISACTGCKLVAMRRQKQKQKES